MSTRKITLLGLTAVLITAGILVLALVGGAPGAVLGVGLIIAGLACGALGFKPEPEPEPSFTTAVRNATRSSDGGLRVGNSNTSGSGGFNISAPSIGRPPRGVRMTSLQRRDIEQGRHTYPDRYDDDGWLLPGFFYLYLDGFDSDYDGDPDGYHGDQQQDGDIRQAEPDGGAPADDPDGPDMQIGDSDYSDVVSSSAPDTVYETQSAPDPAPSYDSPSSDSGSSYDSGSSGGFDGGGSDGGSSGF